ncbi:polyribonucleotide nucleotidyltransferase [Helicobacter sp. 11S02596-1]|uniref:polyribonucleotide nucleotidyltransferase n=1 Tax=Helicobacter sp. 11S02596-1 TaxID=1476194 RepID=UPI000BA61280|nr:polyribonucleotide nucleotidyltransferase [Helicobacter sp. 11S02596-1]PAF41408.1 polyribonucleotide nucleotidyltransferase [Helicobacter sp. 11S02596-1]
MPVNVITLHQENLVEKYTLDLIAKQSSGALWYQNGGTVIVASVAVDEKPVEEDFLPLTVQYIEKSYAVGKFPGGFIKREGKPGEFETLTSRLIDRTLRPIFPKGYTYPTQITIMVLSYDKKSDLQVCALNAAANALYISSLPFFQAVCAVRIGKIGNRFVLNPSPEEMAQSNLDLYVSGSNDDLLMIEMRSLAHSPNTEPTNAEPSAFDISENDLLEALSIAKKSIAKGCLQYQQAFDTHKLPPLDMAFNIPAENPDITAYIKEHFSEKISTAIAQMAKSERNLGLKKIATEVFTSYGEAQGWDLKAILRAIEAQKVKIVREQILSSGIRSDGRGYTDIRPIDIQTNILPFAHGSVLFTRGQTQALVVSTIGSENDAQFQESLSDKGANKEKFMFHYNFPGFSVGEASPISSPNRRELGHGNLAKRALEASILEKSKTIRLVSEIMESNGSSSMASVCGGSLALCASGIPVRALVAGVAMGLVAEGEKYAVLSDINGLEDHDGDMDFKVAGSRNTITAMQMDTKLKGVSFEILEKCLFQAKNARNHILEIMEKARDEIVLNTDILPSMQAFNIHPNKIVEVIGQGGRVIKDIIERFKVSIDLDRENGGVKISGSNHNGVMEAKHFILNLIDSRADSDKYHIGEIFEGEVKKVLDFGVFVGLPKGGDGLLHISRFEKDKAPFIKEQIHDGDKIKCQILGFNKGKIELDLIKE